jgi:hypothetical protein
MPAAITIKSIQKIQSRVLMIFQAALSGNSTAGSDALDFTAAAGDTILGLATFPALQ